jgi:ribonucleoside-diphosphate reductase alpha chain
MFSREEALKASVEYFNDEFPAKTFLEKYALKDNNGNLLEKTPTDMHWRLAKEFARIEKKKFKTPLTAEEIFTYFDKFKYIVPQGCPMAGIGNTYQIQSLGNCFVVPPMMDSYAGILYTDQQQIQLYKRRSGAGSDISNLRPKGLPTNNAAKTTDGVGVFMERISNSCLEVAQNGRRGANLISISVHHPEIETFIKIKQDKNKITGSNVSVRVSDEFMKAVQEDTEYEQRWPVDSKTPTISKKVKARDIWNLIIQCAWSSGDPGLMLWDTAIRESLPDRYKVIDPNFADTSSNPCGEIIQGFDSCRLMTMNLYYYVINPFTDKARFDFELFAQHTEVAQRLMDDLVDLEQEAMDRIIKKIESDPEPIQIKQVELDLWQQLKKNCFAGRRTGLGITALADTLAALNIKYGTEEAIKKTEKIYKQLAISSMRSSCLMAKELGAFPLYYKKVEADHPFLQRLFKADPELETLHNKYGRRNISLTTTSPNGTVSILMQTSSGIEPVFFLSYKRNKKITDEKNSKVSFTDAQGIKWETFDVFHPKLKEWLNITNETDIKKSPYHGATANDVDYFKSVEMQAVAQKWITHSISKTHNLPKKATKGMVEDIYLHAYKMGCKGVTVYRDGCKGNVIESNTDIDPTKTIAKTQAPKRPKSLPCDLFVLPNKKSQILIIVGKLNSDPYEIFAMHTNDEKIIEHDKQYGTINKITRGHYIVKTDKGEVLIKDTHKALNPEEAVITRLISASLRHGADVAFIVHQLEKVEGDWNSFAKAIARVLKSYIVDGTKVTGEECPNCKSTTNLIRESGCVSCRCGWSKCG